MILLSWLSACTPEPEPEDPSRGAVDWTDCDGFLCGTLPSGAAELAVVWHRPDWPTGGLSVMAQGGPGASSIGLLRAVIGGWSEADPALWLDRNWVALDNRGVGNSGAVDCVDDAWFDALRTTEPVPATGVEAEAQRAFRDEFQAGCLADRGEDGLAALGSPTHADDLEILRQVFEAPTIDFVGYSYGSWTGAVYASRHPEHVGRFVLDGVVEPLSTRDRALRLQAGGFELALERFFDRCAADLDCPVHDDPADAWDRLLAAATEAPLPAPTDPWARTLGRNDLRWAASSLLYNPDDEPLADALAAALAGDAALMLGAADDGWGREPETGAYSPTLEGYWAIGCLDLPWPEGWTDTDVWAFGASLDEDFPRLGSALLTGELVCSGWPVTAPPVSVAAPTAPPLLLVGGLYDPATPWAGADAMIDALDNDSRLLTFEGDGHVAMFGDASGCSYLAIRAFLLDGEWPTADCP